MQAGDIIHNKYQIDHTLGEGGMGAVYLAADGEGRKCAVKKQAVSWEMRRLALSEIEIMSKLSHPALPKLLDYFEENDSIYIVMDYIDGYTLGEVLKRKGKVPEIQARRWALELLDILCYLHGRDIPIVYRDLKPSNIMIDAQSHIHLIDFGIAQEYGERADTRRSFLARTKGYAAPEQYDPRYASDARTDIYSFGVTLHYLLTGKDPIAPPYVFKKVRHYDKKLSYAIEEVVHRCLQPNPDKRYADTKELYKGLRSLDETERRIKKRRRLRIALIFAVMSVAVIMLTFVYVNVRDSRRKNIEAYYTLLEDAERLTENGEFEDAIYALNEAIRMEEDSEDAYVRMLDVYIAEGDYQGGFTYVNEELVKRFPDIWDSKDFIERMAVLLSRSGNEEDAEYYINMLKGME